MNGLAAANGLADNQDAPSIDSQPVLTKLGYGNHLSSESGGAAVVAIIGIKVRALFEEPQAQPVVATVIERVHVGWAGDQGVEAVWQFELFDGDSDERRR